MSLNHSSELKFSVVIISKNDFGLESTLSALQTQAEIKHAEIIVVDSSQKKLDWIRKKHSEVRWINFKPRSKITIPEQRNVGIKRSKSNIIVFLDASCIPDGPNWLSTLTNDIVGGKEKIVRGSVSNGHNYVELIMRKGPKAYVTEAPTINLAISKTVFNEIGGFDESFEYGSDIDLTWRAVRHNFRIRYIPKASVSHDFGNTSANATRYYRYGKARAKLYLNHPYNIYSVVHYELKCIFVFLIIATSPLILLMPAFSVFLLGLILLHSKSSNFFGELIERFSFACGLFVGTFRQVSRRS